jgi:hypothetical protein
MFETMQLAVHEMQPLKGAKVGAGVEHVGNPEEFMQGLIGQVQAQLLPVMRQSPFPEVQSWKPPGHWDWERRLQSTVQEELSQ